MDQLIEALIGLLPVGTLAAVALLSGVITTTVDYVKRLALLKYGDGPKPSLWWAGFVALGLGIGAAWAFDLNLLAMLDTAPVAIAVGKTLTGILVGGGAKFIHVVIDRSKAILDGIAGIFKQEPKEPETDDFPGPLEVYPGLSKATVQRLREIATRQREQDDAGGDE